MLSEFSSNGMAQTMSESGLLCTSPVLTRSRAAIERPTRIEPLGTDSRSRLKKLKKQAVSRRNADLAKAIWCAETIGNIQDHYINAFFKMKSGRFYDGWCELEQAEIQLGFLDRHFVEDDGTFSLEFARTQIRRFQELFPYRLFISPAMLKTKFVCTICRSEYAPRRWCGHLPGEIYDGVMCGREITEIRFLELSVVANPRQKYSVLFPGGKGDSGGDVDGFKYDLLRFIMENLASPWHGWSYTWTKTRHPHSRYSHVTASEACPCESGRHYGECCLRESGVLRPHCQVTFEVLPPSGSRSMFKYSDA